MLFSMPQLDMLRANLLGNADRFAEQSLLGSFILCNNPASIQKRERCDEAAKEAALLPDQWQNSMNSMIFLGHPIVSWPSEAFLDHLFPVPAMVVSGPCASIHKLLPTVSIAGTRTEKRFHLRLIPIVMEFQPTELAKPSLSDSVLSQALYAFRGSCLAGNILTGWCPHPRQITADAPDTTD